MDTSSAEETTSPAFSSSLRVGPEVLKDSNWPGNLGLKLNSRGGAGRSGVPGPEVRSVVDVPPGKTEGSTDPSVSRLIGVALLGVPVD